MHVHTSASDGRLSPHEVMTLAASSGVFAIAITDHDTTSGVNLLIESGHHSYGVEIIPGVEINSQWRGRELHILGYYVPLTLGAFQDTLTGLRESRNIRLGRMVHKMASLGYPVDLDRVQELASGESAGRPHIAMAMVEKGYVTSVKEAFQKFLGIGRPGFVDREHLSPHDAVWAIRRSGGVPVWAHPGTAKADSLLPTLIERGLLGIEAYHPDHDSRTAKKYADLATRNGLVVTGGSDFHGIPSGEGGDLGSVTVSYETVLRLRELASP